MSEKLGYRIKESSEKPSKELVKKFKGYPTGNVVDAMDRTGAMNYKIKPVDSSMKMVGVALTVKARPCDNLIIYKALEMAEDGDVLVITNGEYTGASTWGDLTSMIGAQKKIAGMVTDGLIRDIQGISEVGLPVYAQGSSPNSPFKDGPGEINFTISCGGVVVNPGDIIVGDRDGIVVVPREIAEEVAAKLPAIAEKEEKIVKDIKSGKLIPDWVPARLSEVGYKIEK